jgi:hypothetical protein
MSNDGLSYGRAMKTHALPHPCSQPYIAIGLHPVNQNNFSIFENRQVDGGSRFLHQAVEKRGAMAAEGVSGKRHVGQRVQARAKPVTPRLPVALYIPAALIREEKRMPGASGQLQPGCQL